MEKETSLAAWLKLCSTQGLGGDSQRKLMQAFGLPEQVLAMGYPAWRGVIGAKAELLLDEGGNAGIEAAVAWAERPGNTILTLDDPRYPPALLEIPDPPSLLYVRGDVELLSCPAVAIVGSRNASVQGKQTAKAFGQHLSEVGYCVVSGLALGIDTAAHEGALAANAGKTVAVIGTGADRLYPARNKALAEQIVARGTIVSEFPLGTPALPANFPRRNRIISGLSRGVLVVEAALESGSLVTARMALEQGREVMAIPGSIHSPMAKGCHRLIREGAKLVETAEHVLEEIGYLAKAQPANRAAAQTRSLDGLAPELDTLLKFVGFDPTAFDGIVQRSLMPTQDVLGGLLQLEMQGWIVSLSGDAYQRIG